VNDKGITSYVSAGAPDGAPDGDPEGDADTEGACGDETDPGAYVPGVLVLPGKGHRTNVVSAATTQAAISPVYLRYR